MALLTKEKGATVEQVYSKLFKFFVRSKRADNTGDSNNSPEVDLPLLPENREAIIMSLQVKIV